MRLVIRGVLALALGLGSAPALAAPCAGFNDVQDTDNFCSAVEWLKNRAITTGCGGNLYCPNDTVIRAHMALFLNRLGTALSPQLTFVENSYVGVDPDGSPQLCGTGDIAAAAHPRQALVSIAFGGLSVGDLGYSARPLVSTNGGGSWTSLNTVAIRESVTGSAWTNTAATGIYAIPASQSVRFAVGIARESGSASADFSQARCHLTASVLNANGSASPF